MSNTAARKDQLADWQTVKIADAYRFTKKPRELKRNDSTIVPFIPMDLVPQGGNTKTKFIEKAIGEIASGTYFERGDILLSKITPSFENGKQGIADEIQDTYGYTSTEIIPIHEIEGQSSRHFLFYYLLDPEVRHQIAERMEGSTGRQRVPEPLIKDWLMPLPPLAEQKKIAAVLWRIQQSIEVEIDLKRVSRELKSAVMKKLFTEGLNREPQKETEIGLVPASWEIKELREFVTIKSGGTPSREKLDYWNGGTIPWVKTGEVNYCVIEDTSEYITELGMKNSAAKVFPKGTLLMAMYGQGVTRAKVAILGLDATTNQACAAIFPDASVSSVFLYHFLEYQYEQIREMGHGANQKNLNTDIIKAIKCPVPQPLEQAEIARYLDVLNSELIIREKKTDSLKDLFQSALAELMAGTIRVTDLDIDITCLESQGVAA